MNIHPASVRSLSAVARHRTRMTRRQLLRTTAGTAALGGALGPGLFKPGLAVPQTSFGLVPIAAAGEVFHFSSELLICAESIKLRTF